MEKPQFKPEIPQKLATNEQRKERVIEGIEFQEVQKKDGSREYRSSSLDRKIMILSENSKIPEVSKAYRVRVMQDTKPEDPMEGKMIVEITLDLEQEQEIAALAQKAQELFAQNDLDGAIALLEEIQAKANVSDLERHTGAESLKEVREIFGEDFLGIEELGKFRGFELSKDYQEKAAKLWTQKVQEQGLTKENLEQLKREGFMVVLRSPETKLEGKIVDATIENLRKKYPSLFYEQDWYDTENFATTGEVGFGWSIVKKEVLEESRSKDWDEQEAVLKEWAKDHKVDPRFVTRRKPVEIIHDILAYYEARKARILEKDYDWSGTESSDGRLVGVGRFASGGLRVARDSRGGAGSYLGVCPSR